MTEYPQLERDQGRVESLLKEVIARLDRLEAAHRQEMAALRQAMAALDHVHRQEMAALRQEMTASDHALRQEMTALGQHLDRRLSTRNCAGSLVSSSA